MSTIPVLALVNSRRQADAMIGRLRRADIGFEKISAVFPQHVMPTAVSCWIHFRQFLTYSLGRMRLMAVGPMPAGSRGPSIRGLIEQSRFNSDTAGAAERGLRQGQILLCVHAENPSDTAIAWHVFKHYGANLVAVGTAETAAEPILPEAILVSA